MTTLQNLTNKEIIITRLTTVSGNKKSYVTTTGAMTEIQPLSPAKTASYEGVMGKTYVLYADPSVTILEGDRLRETSNSKIYKVRNGGVNRRTFGSIDFLAVIIEHINE